MVIDLDKCSACQVMLRPQVYNDVRTNEQFIICDSCHRILWYDPSRDAEPAKQETALPAAVTSPPPGH